ncbi:hypothetical protein FA95DRAFT_1683718 [Auriscalpium vulgare]|uniref:Uncharacterized protein n=1 Tax=Auriscalpium vulgare TaxID=40419 RepID=A0ACB8R922_9AGAM|nr:hypothetical protein FA95DRAFT_1683718 [Auriscalpium vulgare]
MDSQHPYAPQPCVLAPTRARSISIPPPPHPPPSTGLPPLPQLPFPSSAHLPVPAISQDIALPLSIHPLAPINSLFSDPAWVVAHVSRRSIAIGSRMISTWFVCCRPNAWMRVGSSVALYHPSRRQNPHHPAVLGRICSVRSVELHWVEFCVSPQSRQAAAVYLQVPHEWAILPLALRFLSVVARPLLPLSLAPLSPRRLFPAQPKTQLCCHLLKPERRRGRDSDEHRPATDRRPRIERSVFHGDSSSSSEGSAVVEFPDEYESDTSA